ncbi:hypothetical protein LEP1GSC193_1330 [Leptospira alstonii serovar Pingchang str. 80-412]|uniref:Uncharacterized protein n=1 Tax=Leptospira alstonii serovar Pingchang str. 80-412 TaxID=1218564 RepID=T0FX66_9LEPT|nr:hypothetical protein LEP1GSC193_1330 [Leptospira alstonii serovar Pingchang str. 80-412]
MEIKTKKIGKHTLVALNGGWISDIQTRWKRNYWMMFNPDRVIS